LWQVSAAKWDDPQLGLRVARQWRLGACGITDYLFDTSADLGEAFADARVQAHSQQRGCQ
jgi:Arabinose-binding domain of AraC transcription regulator, N-term